MKSIIAVTGADICLIIGAPAITTWLEQQPPSVNIAISGILLLLLATILYSVVRLLAKRWGWT